LVVVLYAGRAEQQIARLERTAFAVVYERAAAADHDVEFVLLVRRLRLDGTGIQRSPKSNVPPFP
jgi:hypothetical protein